MSAVPKNPQWQMHGRFISAQRSHFLFRKTHHPPLGSPWPAVCLYMAVYSCAAGSGASEAIFRHGPRHSGEGCCMWTGGSPIVLPRASIGVEKACNGPVHTLTLYHHLHAYMHY